MMTQCLHRGVERACGPFRIGDRYTPRLRVRSRGSLDHPLADGERRGSEGRVEVLFNTNRLAHLHLGEERVEGERGAGGRVCVLVVIVVVDAFFVNVLVIIIIVGGLDLDLDLDPDLDLGPEHFEERVGEDGPSNTKREREHQLPTLVSSQILQDHSLLESFISLMDSTEQPYKQHPRVLLGQLERVLVLSDEELWQNQSLLLSVLLSFFLIFSRQKSSSRRRRRRVGEEGSLSDGGR